MLDNTLEMFEIKPGMLCQFQEGYYTDLDMVVRLHEKYGLILGRYKNEQIDPIWNVLIDNEVTRLFEDEIRVIK